MSRRSQPPHRISNETTSPIEPADSIARQSIAARATLVLSDHDRAVFFDVLIDPPGPNDRLKAAFAEHARRVDQSLFELADRIEALDVILGPRKRNPGSINADDAE